MKHGKATLTGILLSSVLATACVQQDAPENIARALPTAESVRINLPETATRIDDGSQDGIASTRNAVLGELAPYYAVTRQVTRDLNRGAGWVLLLVHTIVQTPPTTVDDNVYTWGPGSSALDPADHRLVVTENDDGSFDWSLDGRSKTIADAEFEALIFGHAVPGLEEHRGQGSFTIDFDAGERVNPIDNDEIGLVTVQYNLEDPNDEIPALSMIIDSRELDENGAERDVHFEYLYDENEEGAGNFEFTIHGDLEDAGTAQEDAVIRSRWLATGSGRADLRMQSGDLGDVVVEASECWGDNFGRVFYTDSVEWMPTEGDEGDCSHATSDLPPL